MFEHRYFLINSPHFVPIFYCKWTCINPFLSFLLIFPEIARVRASLFQINGVKKEPLTLPEPEGSVVTMNEKVYVPVREHPDVSGPSSIAMITMI